MNKLLRLLIIAMLLLGVPALVESSAPKEMRPLSQLPSNHSQSATTDVILLESPPVDNLDTTLLVPASLTAETGASDITLLEQENSTRQEPNKQDNDSGAITGGGDSAGDLADLIQNGDIDADATMPGETTMASAAGDDKKPNDKGKQGSGTSYWGCVGGRTLNIAAGGAVLGAVGGGLSLAAGVATGGLWWIGAVGVGFVGGAIGGFLGSLGSCRNPENRSSLQPNDEVEHASSLRIAEGIDLAPPNSCQKPTAARSLARG